MQTIGKKNPFRFKYFYYYFYIVDFHFANEVTFLVLISNVEKFT